MGTQQGSFSGSHLESYLDEYVFRFNRRNAKLRGLLFYRPLQAAVDSPPLAYRDIIKTPRPGTEGPKRLGGNRRPQSLAVPRAPRPRRSGLSDSG